MVLFKFLVDGPPNPLTNFTWISFSLFIAFIVLFINQIRNLNRLKLLPTIIAIPFITTFLSFIGVAWGGAMTLDAIANIPSAQRIQAISTALSVSISSLFTPSFFTLIEIILLVILFTIKLNSTNNKKI